MAARAEALLKGFPPEYSRLPEFLRTCRELQQALVAGKIQTPSEDEIFYLFASGVETLAEERLDRIFDSEFRTKFNAIRVAAGKKEDEYWNPEDPETPEEYRELLELWREKKRATIAPIFREWGQDDAARLILEDYQEYCRRRCEGRERFVSHSPLAAFVTRVLSTDSEEEGEDGDGLEQDDEDEGDDSDTGGEGVGEEDEGEDEEEEEE